jgi:hypothetical protein
MQERSQQVAGQAQEKAQEAAGRAQGMLREQVDQRSTEAGERLSGAASDIRSVGEELRKQGKDTPARFADQAAERTERLGSYMSDADADTILGDVEEFGRRQPLAVLAGGVAVGLVAARFLKASSGRRYRTRIEAEDRTRELGAPSRTPGAAPEAVSQPTDAPVPPAPPEAPVPSGPAVGR